MRTFDEILAIAIERHSKDAIEARLAISAPQIDSKDEAIWLEEMARCIFQAGFNWKVIENKWLGFQTAFDGFDPLRVANYFDEDLDRLLSDREIVRNHAKIKAVIENAAFLNGLTKDHGSAAQFLFDWPSDDLASLLLMLTKKGSRLGGNTGQRLLRNMGKQSYVLSKDVVKRLSIEGVVDKMPTSAKGLNAVQIAFNNWSDQSGRGLTEISKVLALSVD